MSKPDLIVIGGGLAGSEAVWQAAQRGLHVRLYEMRPEVSTGAHLTSNLAELVCPTYQIAPQASLRKSYASSVHY